MSKRNKIIALTSLMILVLIVLIGIGYAFFSAIVEDDNGSSVVLQTADMRLLFTDHGELIMKNVLPGDKVSKEFEVTNIGTGETNYLVYFSEVINDFVNKDELVYSVTCKSVITGTNTESGTCDGIDNEEIAPDTSRLMLIGSNIAPGITHKYIITFHFKETGENQDYNQGRTFSTRITIDEMITVIAMEGYLYDGNSEPLVNKTIEIHSDPVSATTDNHGYYKFDRVITGKHDVIIRDGNSTIKEYPIHIKISEKQNIEDTLVEMPNETNTLGLNIHSKEEELEYTLIPRPELTINTPSDTFASKTKNIIINIDPIGLGMSEDYQYYLSTSDTSLEGGSWTNYENGKEFTIGTDLTNTYYLFVKRIGNALDEYTSVNNITIDNVIYHRFGPYVFDNISPIVSASPSSGTVAKSRNVTINVSDAYLNASNEYQYYLSTSNTSLTGGTWTNYTSGTSFTIGTGLNGTYYLFVKQISDSVGNLSVGGTNITISDAKYHRFGAYIFDNTSPTLTVSPSSGTAAKKRNITITVSDTYLYGSNSYQYYLSTSNTALLGGTWTNYTSGTAFSIGSGLTGTYYLFVKQIRDVAGNNSSINNVTISSVVYHRFGSYVFDNTAPVVTFIRVNNATTSVARVGSTSINLYTSGTGTPSQMCFSNTSSNSSCTWITYATTAQAWTLTSGAGTKTVYVWYRDVAGNVSSAKSVSVTLLDTLKNKVLAAGGGATAIKNKGTPSFSSIATTNMGMYAMADQNGTSYYFRGKITNNYVKFANKVWRIVRINGDGSTRLVLNDYARNSSGTAYSLRYNTNGNCKELGVTNMTISVACVSYGVGSYSSTSIANTVNSWYKSNITGTNLNFIKTDANFCNDYSYTGGSGWTGYGATYRLIDQKSPSLTCTAPSGYTKGSAKRLTLPVGLLTADEVALAGGVFSTSNTSFYLYIGATQWWTMSPAHWGNPPSNDTHCMASGSYSFIRRVTETYAGFRPVINILSTIRASGTGTSSDPYVLYNV